jgi:dipeptidyl aminopeptidase/acylaminoacyl peptidase
MPEPIPIDAFTDLSLVTDLAVSPTGERAAFVARESAPDDDERVTSLFVVPTDGSRDPHRLTRVPGAGAPAWGPAGDRLAFLAARETDLARRVGSADGDDAGSKGGAEGADDSEDEDEDADADASEEDGQSSGDEEGPDRQVWLFDLAVGGDARQVTDFQEGVRDFDWGPDGDRLVVSAPDPTDEEAESLADRREGGPVETERLQHKVDGAGYLDTVTNYLFVVDVGSGESTRLEDAHGGGAFEATQGMDPAWGPTGRIAFTSCRTAAPDDTLVRDVYSIDPDGSDLRRLTDADLAASDPTWSPTGDRLAFLGTHPTNVAVPTAAFVHDLGQGARGDPASRDDPAASSARDPDAIPPEEAPAEAPRAAGSYRSLTGSLDRTIAWTARLDWTGGGEAVYTTVADEGRTRLVRAPVADGDEDATAGPERTFGAQGDGRSLQHVDIPPGSDRAVAVLSHPREGVDLYAVDVAELPAEAPPPSFTRLSAINESLLSEASTPTCRRVAWSSEGHRIEGLLYHDPAVDPEAGPHPLVVGIHGGPASYDEPAFRFDHAALTSRGYLVLRPNYRGGTSYGREFCEALVGRWGTVEVTDVAAGVDHAVSEGWADPDRVFGFGFSYGGILQGYLVTQRPELLTAAAPEHGIYDLRSAFGTDDTQVWYANEYGLPWENPDAVDASSAITDAGAIETPLLVMAGEDDYRCPPTQSEQLYVAARKQGVEAKFVLYREEHHARTDPSRNVHRIETILEWYERFDPARDGDDASHDTDDGSDEESDAD